MDASLHTSKTKLINDRDVGIEDLADERELYMDKDHIQRSQLNLQYDENKKRSDNRVKHVDDCSKWHSDKEYSQHDDAKNKEETFNKEGNIEVLKLITRDKTAEYVSSIGDDANLYGNVPIQTENFPNSHLLMINNNEKKVPLTHIIEEQSNGKQIVREHYHIIPGPTKIQLMPNEIQQQSIVKDDPIAICKSLPNSIEYSYTEPDVKVIYTQKGNEAIPKQTRYEPSPSNQTLTHKIETSLKEQNELLRKILLEKEHLENRYSQKEVILETQSLPGFSVAIGTQTECEIGTQIDSNINFQLTKLVKDQEKFSKRKARSENDDSMSEDEYEYVRFITSSSPEGIYLMKRKKQKNCSKYRGNKQKMRFLNRNRKIRSPIKEESAEITENKKQTSPQKPILGHAETKVDILRHRKNQKQIQKGNAVRRTLFHSEHEVIDISDPLDDEQHSPNSDQTIRIDQIEYYPRYSTCPTEDNDIENAQLDELESKEVALKCSAENKDENYEMHLQCEQANEKSKKRAIKGYSFERDLLPEAELKIKHKTNVQRDKGLERVTNFHDTHKQKSSSLQTLNIKHPERYATSQAEKERIYQSEMELNYQGDRRNDKEFVIKKVPKYMEWYFVKQGTASSKSVSNNSKLLTTRRKSNVLEMGSSKARLGSKPDDASFSLENKPKNVKGFLKEDIERNKQFKPKFKTETSHPLLQHSEYRFERDNVPGIRVPLSNLPHHMHLENPPAPSLKDIHDSSPKENPKQSPISENEVEEKLNPAHGTSTNIPRIYQHLNASALEDDHDSGIAMNSVFTNAIRRNPIADKKSIFSIAYDDVNGVRKIASGGESPEFS